MPGCTEVRSKHVRKCSVFTSVLFLLAMPLLFAGCSTTHGRVPVQGIITGKQQIPPTVNPSEDGEKEKPHYFLWVKTPNGLVLVEVEEEMYQSVTEGEQVCVNCN